MNRSAIVLRLLSSAFVVATAIYVNGVHAASQELPVGKQRVTAAFPCAPERHKQLLGKLEMGDIFMTTLKCTQGDMVFLLAITEYPAQILKELSVEELLDSTLDDARSKKFIKINSSQRTTHEGRPAVRSHILDTRKPETTSISVSVLADSNMIVAMVTAPSALAKSKAAKGFLSSLKIK